MNEAQVIIVGGGAAGIAAATRLVQNGFQNVAVLEAEDRLGGRCNTVALGDEHVDLGAQWIHGETGNVVYNMAAPINLTKDSIFADKIFQFILPNGKPMNPEAGKAFYEYCLKTLDRVTEQTLPPNRALSLDDVNIKSRDDCSKDLKESKIFNQEACQKKELPSNLSLGEVYMKSFNDSQKDVGDFNQLNQDICHGQDLLVNRALSLSEVHLKSSIENLKYPKGDNISNQKICREKDYPSNRASSQGEVYMKHFNDNIMDAEENDNSSQETPQVQQLPSNRALSLGEIQNECFNKNLKDLSELSISGRAVHQKQELPSNCALSIGEVYMKSFNENLKDLNEFKMSDHEIHILLEWYHKFMNSYESADSWYDISFEQYSKYKLCGGNQHVAWKTGGYSNIIDLLLKKLPRTKSEISLNVLFGKEVTQITRKHKVVVECADGSVYTADHVIVCVSLGVLKYAQSMFSPPLPAHKLLAIDTIALGVAEKVFLQFPHRWWPQDSSLLNILLDFHSKEELQRVGKKWLVGVVAFFVLDNAPNTLCCWVGGNSARYISKLPDDVVRDDLHYFLKRYLSAVYTVPAPIRFVRSNWYGNSHFRGAYSFITVRASVSRSSSEDLADPILDISGKPVLMFAGEATHSHFFSTVHGAVETGWREADRLLSYYK